MPDKNNYDMDYRPGSYWGCSQEGFTNIKGEMRRRYLLGAIETGNMDLLSRSCLSDELSNEERHFIGAIHPVFMGGEYLPGYKNGELEIARVSLESVTYDVFSIRARKLYDNRIAYRIVDEYEVKFRCHPAKSKRPLTMAEIISFIDSVEMDGSPDANPGMTNSYRDSNYCIDSNMEDLEELVSFVHVTSLYYPDLESWYEDEAWEWYLDRLVKHKDDC